MGWGGWIAIYWDSPDKGNNMYLPVRCWIYLRYLICQDNFKNRLPKDK
jgi:hypothetical protein